MTPKDYKKLRDSGKIFQHYIKFLGLEDTLIYWYVGINEERHKNCGNEYEKAYEQFF